MNLTRKRFDAWGNPILPHDKMLIYYRDNPEAIEILKSCMPHMFVVIPNVQIEIKLGCPNTVALYVMWPGGEDSCWIYPSKRAWEGLRRTYLGRKGWKVFRTGKGFVTLQKQGTIIRDPLRKYSSIA